MLHKLINHSPDIKKLAEEGYDLQTEGAFLLVHNIPYVNASATIKYGTIVTALTLASPEQTGKPADHTVFFVGDTPCYANGQPLVAIINNSTKRKLTSTLEINHYFSSKPIGGSYPDYYEKIRTYAEILSAQAKVLNPEVTSRPFRKRKAEQEESIFNYPDTNSARAGIEELSSKFKDQRIAIIGLGGTGSYILDLVSKTPVREIHLFDGDVFQIHNAFRAPGAVAKDKFSAQTPFKKTDYYYELYSNIHKGIQSHSLFITTETVETIKDIDFAFICVDNNSIRQLLINHFLRLHIPFIDVGMGIHLVDESLIGTARVTAGDHQFNSHLIKRIGSEENDLNEYDPNIQIADLNCMNAVLAVIKWKKILGFYKDLKKEHHTLYLVNTGKIINDDFGA